MTQKLPSSHVLYYKIKHSCFFVRILEGGGGGKRPGDDGDVRETRKKVKVDYTEEKVHFNNDRLVQVPIYKLPTKVYSSMDF